MKNLAGWLASGLPVCLPLALAACGGVADTTRIELPHPWNPEILPTLDSVVERPQGGDLSSVTDAYGPATVRAGEFDAAAATKPWSSWWYPLADDYLFAPRANGSLSTLQKYDRFVQKNFGYDPASADFERENIYQPRGVSWAGLCDAWALASVLEPEPKNVVHLGGMDFGVGDLKALLLKTYDGIAGLKHFGQRDDSQWDTVYEDIYPEQFHRFLQVELFDKKNAFIMDYDASVEVWNAPVYRAIVKIKNDAANSQVKHVELALVTADSQQVGDVNFVGTREVSRFYTYDLYGKPQPDGSMKVSSGAWTGRSRADHPDYVIPRPEKIERRSVNKKIDPAAVDALLRAGASFRNSSDRIEIE